MKGRLVNHNGRVTEPEVQEVEAIRASDLMKLMEVVKHSTGLYNELERFGVPDDEGVREEFENLAGAMRNLGLIEVQP